MDFDIDDDLQAVRDLADKIFADRARLERVVHVERQLAGFDADLWRLLAESGLLGIGLDARHGGAGLGMSGLTVLLEQQGRRVAAVPLWAVAAGGLLPLAEFGTDEQRDRLLPGVLAGTTLLVGAFETGHGDPAPMSAQRADGGFVLTGALPAVPAAARADFLLVPARLDGGALVVVLVAAGTPGLTITPIDMTDHQSAAAVDLDGVVVAAREVVAGDDERPDGVAGADCLAWTVRRLRIALAALAVGVCEQALEITAAYTSQRLQFGRPLSTNQAVAVRAADAYLDTEAIRVCTQRAAWLVDEGREDEAEVASLVAKWWASRGGLRVVHATQHLHGGIGADVDYPIHRYFLWGRQIAYTLGSADALTAELGDRLPTAPPIGAPA